MTAARPRRGTPLRAGPDHKSPGWRAASFLVAWGVGILLWPWITPDVVHVRGLGRFGVALAVIGLLASVPHGLDWLRGRLAGPAQAEREEVQVREVEGSGGSTYVVVTAPPPAPASAPAGGRGVRVKDVGPGWYLSFVVFYRTPMVLGDLLLTGIWNLVGRMLGRGEEGFGLRSSRLEASVQWPEGEERGAGF